MKLPAGWGVGSVSIRAFDESANDLEVKVTSDGAEPYIVLETMPGGVTFDRGQIRLIADLADELLDLYERMNSEAPDASKGSE